MLRLHPSASAEDIKKAFRREIARYHPDKVQHLGTEFQEIAAVRASELTEAYRVLMDVEQRRRYDESLAEDGVGAPAPAPRPAASRPQTTEPPPSGEPSTAPPPGLDRRFQQERATTNDFVRK